MQTKLELKILLEKLISGQNEKTKRKLKGAELGFELILAGVITIGFLVVIFNLFIGRYFDIKTIIEENTIDRHALALGNLLLSSKRLAYNEEASSITYRGVFEKAKLDTQMISYSNFLNFLKIFDESMVLKEISYPNSVVAVSVVDKETGEAWMIFGNGKMTIEGFSASKYGQCLQSKLKLDAQTAFRTVVNVIVFRVSGLSKLWDSMDLKACQNEFGQSQGTAEFAFPVAIRVSENEVHMGVMNVRLTEY